MRDHEDQVPVRIGPFSEANSRGCRRGVNGPFPVGPRRPFTRMPSVLMAEVPTPARQVFGSAHLGGR